MELENSSAKVEKKADKNKLGSKDGNKKVNKKMDKKIIRSSDTIGDETHKVKVKKTKAIKKEDGVKKGALNFISNWYRNYPYELIYITRNYTHYVKFSKNFDVIEQKEFAPLEKTVPCIVLGSDYVKSTIVELTEKISSKEFEKIMQFKIKTIYSPTILAENTVKWASIDQNRYLVQLVSNKLLQEYEEFFGFNNMPVITSDILGMCNYALYKNNFQKHNNCFINMGMVSTQVVHFIKNRLESIDRFDVGLIDYLQSLEFENVEEGLTLLEKMKFFPETEEEFESVELLENFDKIKKVHFDWVDKINTIKEHGKLKKEMTAFHLMGLESFIPGIDTFLKDYFEITVHANKENWRINRLIGTQVGMHY